MEQGTVDWHSWINTLLSVVIGAGSIAYVRIMVGRARAKVITAKADVEVKNTEREQIMREYGLLLGGLRRELERLQGNQTNMWDFQMNRARLEYRKLEQGGAAIADVLVGARESLGPIRDKLKILYATFVKLDQPERDRVMTLAIIQQFDPFIVEHLCEPYGMSHGECLLIALSVAKNGGDNAHPPGR